MAKLTVEAFARELEAALGSRLVAFLLYGSAARGGHVSKRSDVNTLLICDTVDDALFATLAPALSNWLRQGERTPIIFTEREWRDSTDAFAIEYDELRSAHKLLAGRDPWAGITVRREDVRRQLETELMGKLVRLRQAYAAFRYDGKRLTAVVTDSAAGLFTMLRTVLRLNGRETSDGPADVARAAAALIGFPAAALDDIVAYAQGDGTVSLRPADPRAAAYLAAVTRTVEFVNGMT